MAALCQRGSIGLWMVDAAGTVLDDFGGGSLSGGQSPTPTPTVTPPPTATPDAVTGQINGSSDDVNEDSSIYTADFYTLWIGTSGSVTDSYTRLRFTNLAIPQGATITSAYLEVYSENTQWIAVNLNIAAEAVNDSAAFSAINRPSQRFRTGAWGDHSSDELWPGKSWHALDEMATVVQEVVDRPGWQSGNSLTIILQGTGSQWGRKFIVSYDDDPAYAPHLVVEYIP